jgi:DNA-binding IclR family transcriptional regulator
MHAVSSGQVLLAFRPAAALERYLQQPLERFTEVTLVDPDALRERLRDVRRDGYAWAREEFDRGISSVAAPIADASGEVIAAVHLHGPSYRFPAADVDAAIAERVVTTAARIAGSLRQAERRAIRPGSIRLGNRSFGRRPRLLDSSHHG